MASVIRPPRAVSAALAIALLAMPLLGADCSGGGSGKNAEDTGLDQAGGNSEPDPEPVNFKAREFSGNGSTNIGTIKVPADATLEWTNEGRFRFFSIYDQGFNLNISSEGAQGQSVVAAGTYRNMQVDGNRWTITLGPR